MVCPGLSRSSVAHGTKVRTVTLLGLVAAPQGEMSELTCRKLRATVLVQHGAKAEYLTIGGHTLPKDQASPPPPRINSIRLSASLSPRSTAAGRTSGSMATMSRRIPAFGGTESTGRVPNRSR